MGERTNFERWRDAEDENRRLRSALRQARAHIVKIEGHYLGYDDPEASVAYIDEALSGERTPPPNVPIGPLCDEDAR
jgi:hypothetical protein